MQGFVPVGSTVTASRSQMGQPMRMFKVLTAALAIILTTPAVALAAPSGSASPSASPSQVYVYWAEWEAQAGSTTWVSAQVGAGSVTPADGSSMGWSYGTGTVNDGSSLPSPKADFNLTCGQTPAESGKKRVAVIVNFGPINLAPQGATPPQPLSACATVAPSANGIQVLQSITEVRTTAQGMVCGIDGYPPSGCGTTLEQLASDNNATAQPTATDNEISLWVTVIGGIAIIGLIIAAIVIAKRRRQDG